MPAAKPRRRGLALRRQWAQRERERERDASATLTRPITDPPLTHGLSSTLFPKETTRKTTPSQNDPVPLPRSPSKQLGVDHKDRPKPDLISARNPGGMTDAGGNIPRTVLHVKSPCSSVRRQQLE